MSITCHKSWERQPKVIKMYFETCSRRNEIINQMPQWHAKNATHTVNTQMHTHIRVHN